jgi:diguanylate cyclase (GGDEF)-like protein
VITRQLSRREPATVSAHYPPPHASAHSDAAARIPAELDQVRRPAALAWFVALVTGAGVLSLGYALRSAAITDPGWFVHRAHVAPAVLLLALLAVLGELKPILYRDETSSAVVSASTTFTIATLLVFGWPVAALMQVLACVLAAPMRRAVWWWAVFDAAQLTVALVVTGLLLRALGVRPDPWHLAVPHGALLAALALAGVVYFAIDHLLVWRLRALLRDEPLLSVVRRDIGHQFLATTAVIALAPLVAIVTVVNAWLLPLFVPILIAVHRNVSITRQREHQALHDPLTNLPNRTLLLQRAEAALAETRRGEGRLALFLADLDRFKEVNDTLGHLTGDELLRQVADRLVGAIRDGDTVARLGGDEFAVLVPDLPDLSTARELAKRLGAAFNEPFVLHGFTLELEASIGIALHPDHGSDFETLLARADVAMYQAKQLRTGVAAYDALRDLNTPDRLKLLHDLRSALDKNELDLHYQPKLSFDGSIVGFEALLRWHHATRGPISPEDFVALAEQTGLMPRLTSYVVERALAQAARWWRDGFSVPVAVNVSVRDIHAPGFVADIQNRLLRYGVPPTALVLEITERVLLEEPERAQAVFSSLDSLGVRLSLDDFGTGYSSLVLLRRVPVSEIKIDRSFVTRLMESGDDEVIVRSIIDLGHSLGLKVVAEGVEDLATWRRLESLDCDIGQGWLIARALSPSAATAWLRRRLSGPPYGDPPLPVEDEQPTTPPHALGLGGPNVR